MSAPRSFRARVITGFLGLAVGLSCSFTWASLIQYPAEGSCKGVWLWQPPNVYIMDAIWLVLGQVGHVLVALAVVWAGGTIVAALRAR